MTPDFALSLSFNGISLLRRVPGGWARVGDVALDSEDLRMSLGALRTEADAFPGKAAQVKLALPNEQIKYLDLPDPALEGAALMDHVRAALDGATPYEVADLSFDVSRDGGRLQVAAVANETLNEAEAFAKSHHFEPVCFVAAPPEGAFSGEAFFGPAASWTGPPPEKDDEAIRIVEAPEDPAPLDAEDETAALAPGAADTPDAVPPEDDTPPLAVLTPEDAPSAPAFTSIRASRSDLPPVPSETPSVTADTGTPVKPRFRLGGATKGAEPQPLETPPEETLRARPDARPPASHEPEEPPFEESQHYKDARAAVARIAAMRAGRDPNAAPAPEGDAPPKARRGVFGAAAQTEIGGKPRYLGLMLTAALLVLMLAVAAWASVFTEDGLSGLFKRDDAPSIARMPDVELEPIDGSITEAPKPEAEEIAALEVGPDKTPDTALSDLLPPPAALSPEEADARYAATGIWQRAPEAPDVPSLTTLDDLYVASIDSAVEPHDAVALPTIDPKRRDDGFLALPNPAPAGTPFDLDARGLVIAKPEGALNPDAVRIFAGLPPVVPPARPGAAPPDPADDTDAVIANAVLQGFRPRLRPEGLIEGNERALLGGRTRAELAALRPAARPETLKAAEEEAQPEATQYAVAQSLSPAQRPRDIARIVERARAAQQTRSAQVAAAAPRSVQPRIPSSASVSRQATSPNAINLRKINLIGVYGKPANRRALVRLPNGRFQKVKVGDRLDGGRVAAIGDDALRYVKRGRNVVLGMPDG
ncbi:hypothetical protein [Marivita sp. GX14005]|uniref:hypothetical protein n=1 Tax=Marivita sp. GX14005 TaxID=2942276 RepID=UPI0020198663|nr:hypothetical protein [Marivita sp. GX14005]MCL3883525.1 hypothetical protein [Marivita sp. GX14005]